jgi:hypothetical protein
MFSQTFFAHGTYDIRRVKFATAGGDNQQSAPFLYHGASLRGYQRKFHFVPHYFGLKCSRLRNLKRPANAARKYEATEFIHCNDGIH